MKFKIGDLVEDRSGNIYTVDILFYRHVGVIEGFKQHHPPASKIPRNTVSIIYEKKHIFRKKDLTIFKPTHHDTHFPGNT